MKDKLLEKTVTLEHVSLVDVLGFENKNIKMLSSAFPKSQVISRGNKIYLKGSSDQILKINSILTSLMTYYQKYGKLTSDVVTDFVNGETHQNNNSDENTLLYGTGGTRIYPKTPNQKKLVNIIKKNDLVFAIGPAGTGKTYISVALAVKALKDKEIKKIIITRPVVEAGENLGFLPGDMKEKINPYLRPIYDALYDMMPVEKIKHLENSGQIEIAPLAYMRGRTLGNAYILLDEAQNTTHKQIKMFLTRMASNAKMIITGDLTQIDLPKPQISGLIEATKILKGMEGVDFVEFSEKDVIRHELVKRIIKRYQSYYENKKETE